MACIDKFAVTVERAGGVPAPEGAIVLIGTIVGLSGVQSRFLISRAALMIAAEIR